MTHRKEAQQDLIHEAENGSIATDAESERKQRYRGKDRIPAEVSQGVAEILDEVAHIKLG
jgi:hypothetical protein